MASERVFLSVLRVRMIRINIRILVLLLLLLTPLFIGCGIALNTKVQNIHYGTAFESRFCLNRGKVLLLIGNKTIITDNAVKEDYSSTKELYDFFYQAGYNAFSKNQFSANYQVSNMPSSFFYELSESREDPEDLIVRNLEELEKKYTSVLLIDEIFYSQFSRKTVLVKDYDNPMTFGKFGKFGKFNKSSDPVIMNGRVHMENETKFYNYKEIEMDEYKSPLPGIEYFIPLNKRGSRYSAIRAVFKIISLEKGHNVVEFTTEVRGGFESSFEKSLDKAYTFITYDKSK